MSIQNVTANVGPSPLVIETGKLAKLADGAVTVQMGETIVMVSAVSQTKIREGQTWFPLSVEYKERASAAGTFPGGYFKREGRPTEKEILTCRMTDRPLRPLFPKGYLYDTQIIALLLSADQENDADVLAMNGASAALAISDIPFAGPIGAVRVGRIDGEFVINPTFEQREDSDLDLIYVGNKTDVIMIEGAADEIPDAEFKKSLHFAQAAVAQIVEAQEELVKLAGKPKRDYTVTVAKEDLLEIGYAVAGDRIEDAIYAASKVERGKKVGALRDEVEAAIKEKFPQTTEFEIEQVFEYIQKKAFRLSIMEKGVRADGRGLRDLRELYGEVSTLPRVHGSAIFSRGETQALGICTLAPADEKLYVDNYAGGEDSKNFFLHYNFPPFSVGETGRFGGMNRREIGHGALAERSIAPMLPSTEDFPYSMRISSEVMESNGSTSMATVCAGTMALLDAGVPMIRPVAGISSGLVTEQDADGNMTKHVVILDIIGSEDFYGDMDFKLCGTSEGVTGYQLDLKLPGIPLSILEEGIDLAIEGRGDVLAKMAESITGPSELSPHAPRIETVTIPQDRIGELIGPGGKNIKAIQAESGAELNIEDDGTVHIYASKQEGLEAAKAMIDMMFAEVEIGTTYTGKVMNVTTFGAFMEVLPGKDGLVHISELAEGRVNQVEDICKKGDVITAKCVGIDDKGRVKMSRRAALREGNDGGASPEADAPSDDDVPPSEEEVVTFG
jgi:polyribonucleotide nucleotidyltransferase